nr:hypothetical protein [uncultured Prevotella sp.]
MQVDCKPQFIVYLGSLPWNVAFSSLGQLLKQLEPKEVTEEGIVMLVKPEQLEKHPEPKEVTEERMVMLVKPEQDSKQLFPKEVTEEGIVMLVKPEQL